LLNQVLIKLSPVKWPTHLVPISLFGVRTIPGHVDEVIFAAKSHIQNQYVADKFACWFGCVANLCYYFSDKAFSFIEKHHVFEFWNTTKQVLFSFGFSPSGWFLQTGHC